MITNMAIVEDNLITNVIVIDDENTSMIEQLNAQPIPEGKWIGDYYHTVQDTIKEKEVEISEACNQTIINGVDVETSHGTDHFNLANEDQANISNLFRVVELGGTEYPYQADNGECYAYSAEDIAKIYLATQSHITQQITYHNLLKKYLNTLVADEEVEKVVYGMPLPEEYQTEMTEKLAVAQAQISTIVEKMGLSQEETSEESEPEANT